MIINFLAGPGAGKSTLAAGLFYKLKVAGVNCELVREYAKELCWDNELNNTDPQIITNMQFFRVKEMSEKVDVIVHDTSVLLGAVYGADVSYCLKYESMLHDSHNIFVARTADAAQFEQAGRLQDYKQSCDIDNKITAFMHKHMIHFNTFHKHDIDNIFDHVMGLMDK